MPRQPEGRRVQRIRAYLEDEGALVLNIHGGNNPFQEVGIPDLLVCYLGAFVGLEVKNPEEELSQVQRRMRRRIKAAGGYHARVEDTHDVHQLLAEIRRRR